MVNITQVNLTSGVPSGPAGPATVSTLDNLIGTAGAPVGNVQSIQGITSMVPEGGRLCRHPADLRNHHRHYLLRNDHR